MCSALIVTHTDRLNIYPLLYSNDQINNPIDDAPINSPLIWLQYFRSQTLPFGRLITNYMYRFILVFLKAFKPGAFIS